MARRPVRVKILAAALALAGCGRLRYATVRPPGTTDASIDATEGTDIAASDIQSDTDAIADLPSGDAPRGPACDQIIAFRFNGSMLEVDLLDPLTGAARMVSVVPGLSSLYPSSVTIDVAHGRAYLAGDQGVDAGPRAVIVTFDAATGRYLGQTVLASPSFAGWLAVDDRGVLLGLFHRATEFSLRTIDAATGTFGRDIVLEGMTTLEECSLRFDAARRRLYQVSSTMIATYDTASGIHLSQAAHPNTCFSPFLAADGQLYAGCRDPASFGYWRLDPTTGAATKVVDVGPMGVSLAPCLITFDQARRRVFQSVALGGDEIVVADLIAGTVVTSWPSARRYGAMIFANCP